MACFTELLQDYRAHKHGKTKGAQLGLDTSALYTPKSGNSPAGQDNRKLNLE